MADGKVDDIAPIRQLVADKVHTQLVTDDLNKFVIWWDQNQLQDKGSAERQNAYHAWNAKPRNSRALSILLEKIHCAATVSQVSTTLNVANQKKIHFLQKTQRLHTAYLIDQGKRLDKLDNGEGARKLPTLRPAQRSKGTAAGASTSSS